MSVEAQQNEALAIAHCPFLSRQGSFFESLRTSPPSWSPNQASAEDIIKMTSIMNAEFQRCGVPPPNKKSAFTMLQFKTLVNCFSQNLESFFWIDLKANGADRRIALKFLDYPLFQVEISGMRTTGLAGIDGNKKKVMVDPSLPPKDRFRKATWGLAFNSCNWLKNSELRDVVWMYCVTHLLIANMLLCYVRQAGAIGKPYSKLQIFNKFDLGGRSMDPIPTFKPSTIDVKDCGFSVEAYNKELEAIYGAYWPEGYFAKVAQKPTDERYKNKGPVDPNTLPFCSSIKFVDYRKQDGSITPHSEKCGAVVMWKEQVGDQSKTMIIPVNQCSMFAWKQDPKTKKTTSPQYFVKFAVGINCFYGNGTTSCSNGGFEAHAISIMGESKLDDEQDYSSMMEGASSVGGTVSHVREIDDNMINDLTTIPRSALTAQNLETLTQFTSE